MKEWHIKHMQDTIIKYLAGLPENANRFQRKLHKKYGNLTQVTKRIASNIERSEVITFLTAIKSNQSFSELRKTDGFEDRLNALELTYLKANSKVNPSLSLSHPY
jgi:hypothetical protein